MIRVLELLKMIGVILGMAGAVCVASSSLSVRAGGFMAWIGGNTAWVAVGLITEDIYLFSLFGFYLMTAWLGLRVAVRGI